MNEKRAHATLKGSQNVSFTDDHPPSAHFQNPNPAAVESRK